MHFLRPELLLLLWLPPLWAAAALALRRRRSRRLAALRREIRELRRIINEGEQMAFPWFDLPRPRMKAVEAVHGYMREHPDANILSACRATFRLADGGYPNLKALAAYCYQINLEMYV